MSQLGLGVMIGMLSGNESTVNALKASFGKTIRTVELREERLEFAFEDGTGLSVWDDGQSCCEARYLTCDDALDEFAGCDFTGIEMSETESVGEDDVHETAFLKVTTSTGVFTVCTHNQHNGYYGGFLIRAATRDHVEPQHEA